MSARMKWTDDRLKALGIFDLKKARAHDLGSPTLWALVSDGRLIKFSKGLYHHPDISIDPETAQYVEACHRFGPSSYITALSALHEYGLIDEVPEQIWVCVPSKKRTKLSVFRLLRSSKINPDGILNKKNYKISGIERTIIDCIRFESKIGDEIVAIAAKRAIERGVTSPERIYVLATQMGMKRKILEKWGFLASYKDQG